MNYTDINEKIDTIEGNFEVIDRYIFDWILNLQNEENTYGHLVEFGVHKGKSLCKLAQYQKGAEHVLGLDLYLSQEGAKSNVLNSLKKTSTIQLALIDLFPIQSIYFQDFKFTNEKGVHVNYFKKTRFLHINSICNGTETYSNLELADKLLDNNGILAINNWNNPLYPDVIDAFYRYIAVHPNSFKIIMTSDNKMYACRPHEHQNFIWRAETKLLPFLKDNYKKAYTAIRTKNYVDTAKIVITSKRNNLDNQNPAIDILV